MSTETTMRCEDVAPYLSAFADGELLEPLRSEVAELKRRLDEVLS